MTVLRDAGQPTPRTVHITPAEKELLDVLLDTGAGNVAIGAHLHKTENTIKAQMAGLLRKTNCASRGELMVVIFRDRVRLLVVASPAAAGRGYQPP